MSSSSRSRSHALSPAPAAVACVALLLLGSPVTSEDDLLARPEMSVDVRDPLPTAPTPVIEDLPAEGATVAARHVTTSPTSVRTSVLASPPGSHDIPAAALDAYHRAADVLAQAAPRCRLGWSLLAAIGKVESDHGRYAGSVLGADGVSRPSIFGLPLNGVGPVAVVRDTDDGALDGDTTWDRAVGPMQFLPGTWALAGVDGDGDGRRSPHDLDDAALAAGVYLCAGTSGLDGTAGMHAAALRYNHSEAYATKVLAYERLYRNGDYAVSSPPLVVGPVVDVGVPLRSFAEPPPRPLNPPDSARHSRRRHGEAGDGDRDRSGKEDREEPGGTTHPAHGEEPPSDRPSDTDEGTQPPSAVTPPEDEDPAPEPAEPPSETVPDPPPGTAPGEEGQEPEPADPDPSDPADPTDPADPLPADEDPAEPGAPEPEVPAKDTGAPRPGQAPPDTGPPSGDDGPGQAPEAPGKPDDPGPDASAPEEQPLEESEDDESGDAGSGDERELTGIWQRCHPAFCLDGHPLLLGPPGLLDIGDLDGDGRAAGRDELDALVGSTVRVRVRVSREGWVLVALVVVLPDAG